MNGKPNMDKKISFSMTYVFLALIVFWLLQIWLSPKVINVSYTQFKKHVTDKTINSVVISTNHDAGLKNNTVP